jgi:hypothetical protein
MSRLIDFSLDVKKSKKIALARSLGKYFKISYEDLVEDMDLANDDLLQFDKLQEKNFEEVFYTNELPKLPFDYLIDGDTFVRSNLYVKFTELETTVSDCYRELFMIATIISKDIWVLYRLPRGETGYNGLGGFFINSSEGCFIFEPLKNYLQFRYPKREDGDIELD